MTTCSIYTKQLNESLSQAIVCGNHSFTLTLKWNDGCQEQYDQLKNYVTQLSQADPLYDTVNKTYDRDYDYIEWYTETDVDDLDSLTILPYSLYRASDKTTLFNTRLTNCEEWEETLQMWKETLNWTFYLVENGSTVMTGEIRRQSPYILSDSNVFMFLSNLDDIGEDDLTKIHFLFIESGVS